MPVRERNGKEQAAILHDILNEIPPEGSTGQWPNKAAFHPHINFPEIGPEMIFHFTQTASQEPIGNFNREVLFRNSLSYLLGIAVANNHSVFEFVPPRKDQVQYMSGLRPGRDITVVVNGSVGNRAFEACKDISAYIYGSAGECVGIFGERNRIYVRGEVGAHPLHLAVDSKIDSQMIGPNQFLAKNCKFVAREPSERLFDEEKFGSFLDEAEALIGPVGRGFMGAKMRLSMLFSGNKYRIARPHKQPFYRSINYEQPIIFSPMFT